MEVDYSAEPVAIEVDETNCDQAAFPKLPIIATIAGQVLRLGHAEQCCLSAARCSFRAPNSLPVAVAVPCYSCLRQEWTKLGQSGMQHHASSISQLAIVMWHAGEAADQASRSSRHRAPNPHSPKSFSHRTCHRARMRESQRKGGALSP